MIAMIALILASLPAFTSAEAPFGEAQRQDYLEKALSVYRQTSRRDIENAYHFVGLVERSKCRSSFEGLELACLKEEVQRNCGTGQSRVRKNCSMLSDIIVVNKMNEKQFVSREERFRLAGKKGANVYSEVLDRKYALLTTEMLLYSESSCEPKDGHCFAKELDRYCLQNSDVKNIPWQACVSAIIYFIGKSK